MDIPLPGEVADESQWDQYLVETVPALAKLWNSDKLDQFETYKTLAGLTYKDYINKLDPNSIFMPMIRRLVPKLMASEIAGVQPMSGFINENVKDEDPKA